MVCDFLISQKLKQKPKAKTWIFRGERTCCERQIGKFSFFNTYSSIILPNSRLLSFTLEIVTLIVTPGFSTDIKSTKSLSAMIKMSSHIQPSIKTISPKMF